MFSSSRSLWAIWRLAMYDLLQRQMLVVLKDRNWLPALALASAMPDTFKKSHIAHHKVSEPFEGATHRHLEGSNGWQHLI
jgi:hypothetical protein